MAESPRLLVSVPPDVYRALRRISQLSGRSMASFLRDVAVAAAPSFERIADAMQTARDLDSAHQDAARAALQRAEASISNLTGQASVVLSDALMASSLPPRSAPEDARPSRPRRTRAASGAPSSDAPATPICNTGVTSSPRPAKPLKKHKSRLGRKSTP